MRLAADAIIDSRFRIVEPISSGGMGAVYRAEQLDLQRQVALKFLHPEVDTEKAFKRFRQEAQILSDLKHTNIVAVHCFGSADDLFYIAMEYVEARPLDESIRNERWDDARIEKVFIQICAALEYAHKRGIVHRDIKPQNILVTADDTVKIIDFGLSKSVQGKATQELTDAGSTVGTVMFMSPEQCQGKGVDARSDIYSLGCVLYNVIAGRPPFNDLDPGLVMKKHVEKPLPALPKDRAERWQAIVDHCTAKAADERYQSAEELVHDIRSGAKAVVPRKKAFGNLPLLIGGGVLVVACFIVFLLPTLTMMSSPRIPQPRDMSLAMLLQHGNEAIKEGVFYGAITLGQEAVRREQGNPDRAKSFDLLARAYRLNHNYAEAEQVARQFAAMPLPYGYDGTVTLAEVQLDVSDWKGALATMEMLKQKGGLRTARVYIAFARALRHNGKFEEAAEAAKRGLTGNFEDAAPEAMSSERLHPRQVRPAVSNEERRSLEREIELIRKHDFATV